MSAAAYRALAAGEVAIVPTDTVYGLAALPGSSGYEKIFELKQRPAGQVLPWLVPGADALDTYAAEASPAARRLARRFWPGALTIVVRASKRAQELGSVAPDGTVALRCPDEPTCLNLLERLGKPLCCTSANLHGAPAVSRRAELDPSFADVAGFGERRRSSIARGKHCRFCARARFPSSSCAKLPASMLHSNGKQKRREGLTWEVCASQ